MFKKLVITLFATVTVLAVAACSAQATAQPQAQTQKPPATQVTNIVVPPQTTAPLSVPAKQPEGRIKGTWIDVSLTGDSVSIPVSTIYNDWDTHFKINTAGRTLTFMAYLWNGSVYVRANVCPPCRSIGFSLNKDILVCDTCGTTFQAKTGAGISGACVAFPKAAVQYTTADNKIIMNVGDLVSAYDKTQKG